MYQSCHFLHKQDQRAFHEKLGFGSPCRRNGYSIDSESLQLAASGDVDTVMIQPQQGGCLQADVIYLLILDSGSIGFWNEKVATNDPFNLAVETPIIMISGIMGTLSWQANLRK